MFSLPNNCSEEPARANTGVSPDAVAEELEPFNVILTDMLLSTGGIKVKSRR